jgi:hypothetical protein
LTKISAKATNERRQQVWLMSLKGENPISMAKALNVSHVTIYNDLKFLTKKSKHYVYNLARGTHVLLYQRAIEGISLTLARAWAKFEDPRVPEQQKPAYLRLTMEAHESMIELISNGPTVMAVQDLTRRAERALGIDTGNNNNINESENGLS